MDGPELYQKFTQILDELLVISHLIIYSYIDKLFKLRFCLWYFSVLVFCKKFTLLIDTIYIQTVSKLFIDRLVVFL